MFLFLPSFPWALPDLQRMKHRPDQAFEHREVFYFFLAFCLAAPSSYRVDRGRHLASSTFGGVEPGGLQVGIEFGTNDEIDRIAERVAACMYEVLHLVEYGRPEGSVRGNDMSCLLLT